MISHLLWIGCHSVVLQLCQKNAELTKSLRKMVKFVDNYTFVEFAAYCGFPDIEIILEINQETLNSLCFHCIEGYKNDGRVQDLEDKLGYKNKDKAVNYFETTSRQRGYGACLQKLYKGTKNLKKDLPVILSVTEIMKNVFESQTIGFINNENIQNNSKLFQISSAKMAVLQLLHQMFFA